jgi:hypothetical protein
MPVHALAIIVKKLFLKSLVILQGFLLENQNILFYCVAQYVFWHKKNIPEPGGVNVIKLY